MKALLRNPARAVPLAFLLVIFVGTAALMLPFATGSDTAAPFLTALFVATSAVGVTGLTPVDTALYWSGFGQGIIYFLFHVGGFGIMSAASLLGLVVTRRLGLGRQLALQAEVRGIAAGDVRSVLILVVGIGLIVESIAAALLYARMVADSGHSLLNFWHAIFLAGSAYTNAGFLARDYGLDAATGSRLMPLVCMVATVIGGLGLPALHELRYCKTARWSLHLRLTLLGTTVLFLLGGLGTLAFEWSNQATLGPLSLTDKAIAAMFHSVNTRSGGLSSFDTGAITEETMLITYALMLTGAGSASMGGGIKVTTLMIMILAVWSEMRGDTDTTAFGRRISPSVLREAMTVTTLAVATLMVATMVLREVTDLPLNALIFEAISAFGNVGLSMGITAELPPAAQYIIILLMYLGRVGIITVATGLALRSRRADFRYPEERPIVG
jgi:trk system potassium uptake protein TrkH